MAQRNGWVRRSRSLAPVSVKSGIRHGADRLWQSSSMNRRRFYPNLVLWLFPLAVLALAAAAIWGLFALTATFSEGRGFSILGRILVAPLVFALFLGVRAALRYKAEPAEGIEVTAAEHPALWAEVNQLAALAQTEPPSRIVIVPEVNAAVTQAAGHRELLIGLPLLASFTRSQLRAVLAHELGHFAGGDTAASAAILRRIVLLDRVRDHAGWVWRWFFALYARLYAVAAGPASREAELRADDLSRQAAGVPAATSALRALVRTELAWDVVLESYVPLFPLAGRRASLGEALWRMLRANAHELEAATDAALTAEKTSAADTHPPLRDRIARMAQSQGAMASPADNDVPAVELLNGGAGWLTAAEGQLLAEDRPLASWDEVIARGVRQTVDSGADRLGAWLRTQRLGDGGLPSVLALIDDRSAGGLVNRLVGTGPEARQEAIEALFDPVVAAMLDCGAAVVEPSWTGAARILERDGGELDVESRLGHAIDSGDSSALRSWLAGLGVDVAGARLAAGVPQWLAALSHVTGPWEGRRDVHLWSTGVLALPPLDKATVKENKEQISEKHQHPRLYRAAAEGLEAGRRLPGSLWWEAGRIVGGEASGRVKFRLRFELADAPPLELSATLESVAIDSAEEVGSAFAYLTAPKAPLA